MITIDNKATCAINGEDKNTAGQSGTAVSSAGDVNGDGLDDLVIGAPRSLPYDTGKVFVVFGKKDDEII
jgi:hypothetical protein